MLPNYNWFILDDVKAATQEKDISAEDLKTAVKVLEDKIKELETPKYTPRQQEFLDEDSWRYKGMRVMAYSHGKGCRIWDEEEVKKYAQGVDLDYGVCATTCELYLNYEHFPMVEIQGELYVHWDRL